MSHIRILQGNLITLFKKGEFDVLAHGCNCHKTLANGTSGGIGAIIGKEFYNSKLADDETKYADKNKLGTYSIGFSRVKGNKLGVILNCYTQFKPGADISYNALALAMRRINKDFKGKHVAMPLIGCGIAGGDWEIVESIIEEEMTDVKVTIVVLPNAEGFSKSL